MGAIVSDYVMPEPEIQGWMGLEECNWLYHKAQEMEFVVEVGCWLGRSTHALLSGCSGKVVAVDHWKGSVDERDGNHALASQVDVCQLFYQNVGHFPNLFILRGESTEAAKIFPPKSVDMVFIDAGHGFEEVLADLVAWSPICKKLLCGHDLSYGSVRDALERQKFNFIHAIDAIWAVDMANPFKEG